MSDGNSGSEGADNLKTGTSQQSTAGSPPADPQTTNPAYPVDQGGQGGGE